MKRRAVVPALLLLAAIHAAAICANFLAPYAYDQQNRDYAYAPPARLHWHGGRLVVYGLRQEPGGEYQEDPGRQYTLRFLVGGRLMGVDPPGTLFLLGTDGLGRDVFSRVLYGGRISLMTGLRPRWRSGSGGCWERPPGFSEADRTRF